MNEYTSAATVANGLLCSALIDVLIENGTLSREDALKVVSVALQQATPFTKEAFGQRLVGYLSDTSKQIAKRK